MLNGVKGVRWITLNPHSDERGSLAVLETGDALGLDIKRVYYIYDVPENTVRGKHAHGGVKQVLICVHGSVEMVLYDGGTETVVLLDKPNEGILIEGYVWREMRNFSKGSVLMCVTDSLFSEVKYVFDRDEVHN